MGDRILGGIGLIFAVLYIWQATLVQVSFISDPIGPKVFPIIIGTLLAICSVVIILQPDPRPDWPPMARLAEIGLSVLVLCLYAWALPVVGFLISTAVAAAFLSWRLGTTAVQGMISGVATSIGIYVIFHLVLGLSLAEGPFGV